MAAGLAAITCPVVTEVQNRDKFGYTTYRYLYSGNFSNITPLPWIGATHSGKFYFLERLEILSLSTSPRADSNGRFLAELPLLFGTHYEYRGNSTDFEWETSIGMQGKPDSIQRPQCQWFD